MKNKIKQILICLFFLWLGILIGNYTRIPEDVDNNGRVNSKDLFLVKKYLIEESD